MDYKIKKMKVNNRKNKKNKIIKFKIALNYLTHNKIATINQKN